MSLKNIQVQNNYPISKTAIRKKILKSRLSLPDAQIKLLSDSICRQTIRLLATLNKNGVAVYLAVHNEVITDQIIDYLLKNKSTVLVPAFMTNKKAYSFVNFESWNNLGEGPHEILQPKNLEIVDTAKIEVAIIPAIAFSKNRVRLGYGKGVYDRLLANSKTLKIGLVYDFQILNAMPSDEHDLVADIVISEKRFLGRS